MDQAKRKLTQGDAGWRDNDSADTAKSVER